MSRTVLGRFTNSELVEGTDETRRAAWEKRVAAARVAASRAHHGFREYRPEELTPRRHGLRTYYVTLDGDVLANARSSMIFREVRRDDMEVGCSIWNEGAADSFVVNADGSVSVFEPAPVPTLTQLELIEKQIAHRRRQDQLRESERDLKVQAFRRQQPLRQVTLGDVERRPLPTVRAAAEAVLDVGGKLTVRHGVLQVELPERLAPGGDDEQLRAALHDAALVLVAAGGVVLGAIGSASKKPLLERLPDVQVLAGGGLE